MYYTDRLMLRSFDLRDETMLTHMFNDVESMWAMAPEAPRPGQYNVKQFLEAAIKAGEKGPASFAICLKPEQSEHPNQLGASDDLYVKDNKPRYPMIGMLNFRGVPWMSFVNRVVGFGINFVEEHQGKGYGFEALSWGMKYLFEDLNIHKCECTVSSENARAIRLYEKIGFVREGTLRKRFFRNGKWVDDLNYGLLEEEYHARKGKS